MFLTRQLWKALRYPMRQHPIFIYARRQYPSKELPSRLLPLFMLVALIIFVIVLPMPALVTTLGLILVLPLLLILFNGTILGTIWISGVSEVIASAHQDNRFELMSISPQGAMGVSWLLGTGVIHRHNWLREVYRIVKWVVMLVLVLLGLAIIMLLIGAFTSDSEALRNQQISVLREVINICLIVGALWLDHIQSIVIATVLGILLPNFIKDKVQLRTLAPMLYLIGQGATYLALFIVYRLMSIIIIGILGQIFLASILVIGLSVIIFYLMREAIIATLWRLIVVKYNASLDDYAVSA